MTNDKTYVRASIPPTPLLVVQGAPLLVGLGAYAVRQGRRAPAIIDHASSSRSPRWGAAFVQRVGFQMHADPSGRWSSWDLPMTGGFDEMHAFGDARGVVTDEPMVGDIALVCDRKTGRYLQGGFVLGIKGSGRVGGKGPLYYDCITIEGNTDLHGALDGPEVCRVCRRLVPDWNDCFIRWVELDARGATATPWERTEVIMGHVRLGKAA